MKTTYRFSIKTIVLLFTLAMLCSTVHAENTSIAIGTGGTGGGYYPMGGAVATLIADKIAGVTASAQVTAASLENCRLIQKNDVQMALASAAIMYGYVDKKLKPKEFPGISSVMSAGTADIMIVTLKSKDSINSLKDLKGKRVGLGAPGSATEVMNKLVLSGVGLFDLESGELGVKPAYLSFAEMTAGLKDGRLDAAMYFTSGRPASAIVDLSTVRDIKLLSIDEGSIMKLTKQYPFMVPTTHPKGVYKGVDYETRTVLANDVFACKSDLDTDLVYQITKVIHENLPQLGKTGHHGFKSWALTRSVSGVFPLHPGAKKYMDEKGVK
jgi:hypothetical protein